MDFIKSEMHHSQTHSENQVHTGRTGKVGCKPNVEVYLLQDKEAPPIFRTKVFQGLAFSSSNITFALCNFSL
jgi:hypothetical protein